MVHKATLMATVTILDQTYTLPTVTAERFRTLQTQVQEQQQAIHQGVRPRSRLLGLIPRQPVRLSPEERWSELDLLVCNYDAILAELCVSKETYQTFLAQLAAGVQRAVCSKSAMMRCLEEERLADAQTAQAQNDETLLRLAHEDGARLLHGARLLGQAALLLLKKIALVQEGLTRLVEDQELQQRLLTDLVGRLELHRRAYERRQRIDQVLREVADMAHVALEFETYMREHLGPLQAMLDRVVQLDSGLYHTVTEIEALTQQMLQQGAVALPDSEALDGSWLDFLTTNQVKKERLHDVWERLEQQDGVVEGLEVDIATSVAAPSVLTALDNIDGLVEMRLGTLAREEPATPPLSPQGCALPEELATPRTPFQERSPSLVEMRLETCAQEAPVTPGPSSQEHSLPEDPTILMPSSHKPSLVNSTGMAFVRIPAGEFRMGSNRGYNDEKPVHTVSISRPFFLGQYLVTQAQWEAVMGSNPSRFKGDPNRPVENIFWSDMQLFIQKLQEWEPGVIYRLPTEAEWEYAARAGSTEEYYFGDDKAQLPRYAWYNVNAKGVTHPVGYLQPNAWGLYDMHGNVWERVQDWYGPYTKSIAVNPTGPTVGSDRVLRGGSWNGVASLCRSASRDHDTPGHRRRDDLGFRLLREVS
jgi:formylglycine-generating enzyme required for sulfatase activity